MSIYEKAVSAITTFDLTDLLAEAAVENVRLEFKREVPVKDETLKKLSSFANTYGGYLIVGAEAGNDGRLIALDGIPAQPGYKQKIVQWCFDSIAPPIQPFVSDPIQAPGNPAQVVYVIYVEESAESPHFLNSRKGCWIRIDEFSQRIETKLATYEEIQHLANRRSVANTRREQSFDRANQRFEAYVRLDYQDTPGVVGNIGATLKVAVSPRFPVTPLVEQLTLSDLIEGSRIKAGGTAFPMQSKQSIHQLESVVVPNAFGRFSMFQLDVWGHVFYAVELEEQGPSSEGGQAVMGVRLLELVSDLLVCTHHSSRVFDALGYDGTLQLMLRLERILRIPFWRPRYRHHAFASWVTDPMSRYDDEAGFTISTDTRELSSNPGEVTRKLLLVALHAIDWPDAGNDEELDRLINAGYESNHWPRPQQVKRVHE